MELLAALDQVRNAPADKMSARLFIAREAADVVLTNVAAHAADAVSEQNPVRKTRQEASAWRKNRRFDAGGLPRQRALFA